MLLTGCTKLKQNAVRIDHHYMKHLRVHISLLLCKLNGKKDYSNNQIQHQLKLKVNKIHAYAVANTVTQKHPLYDKATLLVNICLIQGITL